MILPTVDQKPILRIACFAYAEKSAGSVSSANFLMLRALLERGHEIDFFNKRTFIYPKELLEFPNFRYVDCYNELGERAYHLSTRFKSQAVRYLCGRVTHKTFVRKIVRSMRRDHASRRYDLQLSMGTTAFGRVGDVPVISWTQGPPMTDGRSIPRHRSQLVQLCGRRSYLQLSAFAKWRSTFGLPRFANSDYFITGSQWSRTAIQQYGIDADKTIAIPYPIDLEQFTTSLRATSKEEIFVLWLGRVVPRKRLDLFLDACSLLIERGFPLRIKIIGGFSFVPGYKQLIDRFKYPERLVYQSSIDRAQVNQLMSETDLVLQPSEEEDFASTPAEALACGVPVVLGKTNGTADYVDDAAEMFDEYTPQSVAVAVEKMIARLRTDPAGIARKARAAAEQHFQLSHVVDQLESLLYRVASPKAVSR